MRLYNYELEQHLLSGILKNPDIFFEISSFISEKDFYSEYTIVHKSIFLIIKSFIEEGKPLDEVLISEKIKSLGIKFDEGIDCLEYIQGLLLRQIGKKTTIQTAKDLKILTIKRDFCDVGSKLNESMKSTKADNYKEIIEIADEIYHNKINHYESGGSYPENVYDSMEEIIEERGENPIDDFGLQGPHQRLHEIYGSLLRPGNITVIVARSGIGKTQFCMDFCTKVSSLNENIPILHFDNGEMSFEELTMRQCAAISGVQLSLLETGRWRQAGIETVNKVRKVWKQVKNMQFYYYNCGGLSVQEMVNVLKRFIFQKLAEVTK